MGGSWLWLFDDGQWLGGGLLMLMYVFEAAQPGSWLSFSSCQWLGGGLLLSVFVCLAAVRELAAALCVRRWMGDGLSLLVCVCVTAARELAAAFHGGQWLGGGLLLRRYVCEAVASQFGYGSLRWPVIGRWNVVGYVCEAKHPESWLRLFAAAKWLGGRYVAACVCLRQVSRVTRLDRPLG